MPEIKFGPGEWIPEKSTAHFSCVIKDQSGTPIDPSAVSVLTFNLLDASGAFVNDLDTVDILNTAKGTLVTGGVLTVRFDPDDTVALGAQEKQLRLMPIFIRFSCGEQWQPVSFFVKNIIGVS
jgi:hypothetical protein